jgi:hypothetical protein
MPGTAAKMLAGVAQEVTPGRSSQERYLGRVSHGDVLLLPPRIFMARPSLQGRRGSAHGLINHGFRFNS